MTKTLDFVVRTYSTDPDCDDDCDYAVVILDTSGMQKLKRRIGETERLLKKDSLLVALEYLDSTARYFQGFEELESLLDVERVDKGEAVLVNAEVLGKIPEEAYRRTELQTVVVFPEAVYWTCRPRHYDNVRIETAEVKEAFLRKAWKAGGSR